MLPRAPSKREKEDKRKKLSNERLTALQSHCFATGYWLRGEQLRGWCLSPSRVQKFLCSMSSRPVGTHSSPYPMGTGDSFSYGKATGSWSWPHTHILNRYRISEMWNLSEIIQQCQGTAILWFWRIKRLFAQCKIFFFTFKNSTKPPHLLRMNCHTTFSGTESAEDQELL
jgi:hypothetical protein